MPDKSKSSTRIVGTGFEPGSYDTARMDLDGRYHMTWDEVYARLDALEIDREGTVVHGVPRGGRVVASLLRVASVVDTPGVAGVVLDDIIDSGVTRQRYHGKRFLALVDKLGNEKDAALRWVVFPWEREDPAEDQDRYNLKMGEYKTENVEEEAVEAFLEEGVGEPISIKDAHQIEMTTPSGEKIIMTAKEFEAYQARCTLDHADEFFANAPPPSTIPDIPVPSTPTPPPNDIKQGDTKPLPPVLSTVGTETGRIQCKEPNVSEDPFDAEKVLTVGQILNPEKYPYPPDPLPDTQAQPDTRGVPVLAGVCGLRIPAQVPTKIGGRVATIARVSAAAGVAPDVKGTHMSRLVLESTSVMLGEDPDCWQRLGHRLIELLETHFIGLRIEFDLPQKWRAPVTGAEGWELIRCKVRFNLVRRPEGDKDPGIRTMDHRLQVTVPVTTLCPCSKAISAFGAHNQRAWVKLDIQPPTMEVGADGFVWFEDMISVCRAAGSCPVFPVLKRPDERWVTERAYSNPKFVEDVVRDVAVVLREKWNLTEELYCVECESEESIHAHNAFASAGGFGN